MQKITIYKCENNFDDMEKFLPFGLFAIYEYPHKSSEQSAEQSD